jgi:hypothetical protein
MLALCAAKTMREAHKPSTELHGGGLTSKLPSMRDEETKWAQRAKVKHVQEGKKH